MVCINVPCLSYYSNRVQRGVSQSQKKRYTKQFLSQTFKIENARSKVYSTCPNSFSF